MFNLFIILVNATCETKYKCEKVIIFNNRLLARVICDNGLYQYLNIDMSTIAYYEVSLDV